MKTLVIDCATEACSTALFDRDTLIAGDHAVLGRGHAERLIPMIAQLPGRGRADRIAVALGPGSFTGIRVGLAAGRALGVAWGVPLLGYHTHALVAAQAVADAGEPVAVCNTGGHGEWFVQSFGDDATPLDAVRSLRPDDAAAAIVCERIAGNQAEALVARRGSGTAMPMLPDARRFPLLHAARLTGDVRPAYGRGPDAKLPGGIEPPALTG
ncbi:tRNA (adenosine(37)-N6)-threonylcarbamoyltransferase complex dimerization subunit type 1 TsaB [uncultured Croceicoccus sp.]|uniref:tRNA (adenosine(37)-N6)-threonylcarbamoyltransferase complex dimerization subunit type 1 TsaB n=1 Tax=uncultured Croceicoccus sp. TaxID=1295329 RepID=UPI00261F8981|nr:tRNA (adenosine(37)-N6)-threonylcarbamoyltransferase complex dimerization subunit type 1 TsaB [uncultured Croceicoccus sp.]